MTDDFADFIEDTGEKPSNIESVLYLFWDKGIDYNTFCELPIPYILSILKAHTYIKKEEEKAHERANRNNR